jgi:hypothetical protein
VDTFREGNYVSRGQEQTNKTIMASWGVLSSKNEFWIGEQNSKLNIVLNTQLNTQSKLHFFLSTETTSFFFLFPLLYGEGWG